MPVISFSLRPSEIAQVFCKSSPLASQHKAHLRRSYVEAALQHKARHCKEMMATSCVSCVRAMLRLFDAQAMPSKFGAELRGQDGKEQEWATLLEMWWQFSVAWGLGGMLTEEGRKACVLALNPPIMLLA